jgi:hypothetical protein
LPCRSLAAASSQRWRCSGVLGLAMFDWYWRRRRGTAGGRE